jgi:hypothetical protein
VISALVTGDADEDDNEEAGDDDEINEEDDDEDVSLGRVFGAYLDNWLISRCGLKGKRVCFKTSWVNQSLKMMKMPWMMTMMTTMMMNKVFASDILVVSSRELEFETLLLQLVQSKHGEDQHILREDI